MLASFLTSRGLWGFEGLARDSENNLVGYPLFNAEKIKRKDLRAQGGAEIDPANNDEHVEDNREEH